SFLALIALSLWLAVDLPLVLAAGIFFVLWTLYAFISGIVAVPYNDIVGRSIPSKARSRMLAWRFFGGGILALGMAAIVHRILAGWPLLTAYAMIFALASLLMFVSAIIFVWAGEPPTATAKTKTHGKFRDFLRDGWQTLRTDSRFRLFLYTQWLGGLAMMALLFYVITRLPPAV
ncbi:MAG: hypothetical protein JKY94_07265, partial [Rhodobacteraceae bacterium]|nr:hypothetical protein [Paracoccaceae bacterium]